MKRLLIVILILIVLSCSDNEDKYRVETISILGDSISSFYSASTPGNIAFYPCDDVTTAYDLWWSILSREIGIRIEENNSFSGSMISGTDPTSFIDRCISLGDSPDIIIIFGGTNDKMANVPLGEYEYESDLECLDESFFRQAYIKLIKLIRLTYPDSEVINVAGSYLSEDYVNSIFDISNYFNCSFCEFSENPYSTFDGIHPNKEGMNQIAKKMNPLVLDIFFN